MGLKFFRVFEAGAGINPIGLLKKAISSNKKKTRRVFTAADLVLDIPGTLAKTGLKQPRNFMAVRGCAIQALERKKPMSQNLIFAGMMLQDMAFQEHSAQLGTNKVRKFFAEAKRKLAPNGRLVLIQHLKDKDYFIQLAKEAGFLPYFRELTEQEAKSAESPAIRRVSTHEARVAIIDDLVKRTINPSERFNEIDEMTKSRGLSNHTDLYKPILISLRLPKK